MYRVISMIIYSILSAIGATLRLTPTPIFYRIAQILGTLFRVGHLSRSRIVSKNLERLAHTHSVQDRLRIHKESYTHLSLTILEALRAVGASPLSSQVLQSDSFRQHKVIRAFPRGPTLLIRGDDHLYDALERGRGVILFSAHLGSWETLLCLSQLIERPLWLISKRFSSTLAQMIWDQARKVAPPRLDRGARARFILNALKRGEGVIDLLDQHDPRPKALSLPFLGHPAYTSPDLARLSILSGAPLIPIFTWRCSEGHIVSILPPIEPPHVPHGEITINNLSALTSRCLASIEAHILAYPEQWMWVHRRWKK
jgi:lauroyl/myristoyl acyltransferase